MRGYDLCTTTVDMRGLVFQGYFILYIPKWGNHSLINVITLV